MGADIIVFTPKAPPRPKPTITATLSRIRGIYQAKISYNGKVYAVCASPSLECVLNMLPHAVFPKS